MASKRHNYYEIYCERGRTCECDSDNFSLCLKVPAGMKCPTCKEVEKFLGKKVLTIDGVRYHVVSLCSDREGGWSHKEFRKEDIFLFPESKYYILDFIPMCSDSYMDVFEVSEKELIESLRYNHSVAKEYGDEVPSLRKTIKDLKSSLNYEAERMNAMGFLKLTTMTPAQWGYTE